MQCNTTGLCVRYVAAQKGSMQVCLGGAMNASEEPLRLALQVAQEFPREVDGEGAGRGGHGGGQGMYN